MILSTSSRQVARNPTFGCPFERKMVQSRTPRTSGSMRGGRTHQKRICKYIHIYIYILFYMYIYICVYIYMYIYIFAGPEHVPLQRHKAKPRPEDPSADRASPATSGGGETCCHTRMSPVLACGSADRSPGEVCSGFSLTSVAITWAEIKTLVFVRIRVPFFHSLSSILGAASDSCFFWNTFLVFGSTRKRRWSPTSMDPNLGPLGPAG